MLYILTNLHLLFNLRIVSNLSRFNLRRMLFQYYNFGGETTYLWYKMKYDFSALCIMPAQFVNYYIHGTGEARGRAPHHRDVAAALSLLFSYEKASPFACACGVGVIFSPFTLPAPYPFFFLHSFFAHSLFLPKAKFSDSF